MENPNGWGARRGLERGDIRVERSLVSAGEDPRFGEVAAQTLGDMGMVHLRSATPPLPVTMENSHPFIRDGLMMAHNGAIYPQETLDDILVPGGRYEPRGTTDSERYFLAIARRRSRAAPIPSRRSAHRRAHPRAVPAELPQRLPHDGDHLYAISWHQPEPYRPEYYRLFSPEVLETYFEIRYALGDDGIVLASTGWGGRAGTPFPAGPHPRGAAADARADGARPLLDRLPAAWLSRTQ